MKFNKTLRKYAEKYGKHIPVDKWFDYKGVKKQIKYILQTFPDEVAVHPDIPDECCICLENSSNMMNMFCCNQCIHYSCFILSIVYSTYLCPLCRTDCIQYFRDTSTDCKHLFNIKIVTLLCSVFLNINKIEEVYRMSHTKNSDIMAKYCSINYTAVIKISKKIGKCLKIDMREFFLNIMKKKNILQPYNESHTNVFYRWAKAYKQKLMF